MPIKLKVEGIIKLKKALKSYNSKMRKAILKAQEETAIEYQKLVYHEFDNLISAEEFFDIVEDHFNQMIVSRTGKLRAGLQLRKINGEYRVGWFNNEPDYAKYVVLGTIHMLPRNPILEAIKTIEMPNRFLWQDEEKSQIGSVLPIMSRGFEDPTVAEAYFQGVQYNLDAMIALQTGKMRDSLRIKKVGNIYRVGWFEDAPSYVKFVLMGTMNMLPRNPLIHAWDHEYLLKFMESILKQELARAG